MLVSHLYSSLLLLNTKMNTTIENTPSSEAKYVKLEDDLDDEQLPKSEAKIKQDNNSQSEVNHHHHHHYHRSILKSPPTCEHQNPTHGNSISNEKVNNDAQRSSNVNKENKKVEQHHHHHHHHYYYDGGYPPYYFHHHGLGLGWGWGGWC
jgi:hypothetical protein